jgi:DNA invertase Pin-like site-specific DNA recombinase
MTCERTLAMPRGRKTDLHITLSPEDRVTLSAWQRQRRPGGLAQRGHMLLLLAQGWTITAVARRVGCGRPTVYRWATRFLAEGVTGLTTQPGPGGRS